MGKFGFVCCESSGNGSMTSGDTSYTNSSTDESHFEAARPSSFFSEEFSWNVRPQDPSEVALDLRSKSKLNRSKRYHPFCLPPLKEALEGDDSVMAPFPDSSWSSDSSTETLDEMDFPEDVAALAFDEFEPSGNSTLQSETWEASEPSLHRSKKFYWKPTFEPRLRKRKLEENEENQPPKRKKTEVAQEVEQELRQKENAPLVRPARLFAVPKRREPASQKCCEFCKRNGEHPLVYSHHTLKDTKGRTLCPVLRQMECPLCHADGDDAHEAQDCPHRHNWPANGSLMGVSYIRRHLGILRI